jgi:hypothetical protein
MTVGPLALGMVMNAGGDEDFLKRLTQDWARKRLGLKEENRDSEK